MTSFGLEIARLRAIPSTMDELDRRARAGAAEGLVVVADKQTAGRGRAGRTWEAPVGSSLLCSILLRPSAHPDGIGALPLLIGVAVAEAIEELTGTACGLRWPNDVLIGERKVAGVLMQSRVQGDVVAYVNAGIGVNLTQPDDAIPDGGISVLGASGKAVDRDAFLMKLLERLTATYARFQMGVIDLAAWLDRARYLGEAVEIRQGERMLTGRFTGVSPGGALVLELDGGSRIEVVSGDLTRGPRPRR